MFNSPSDGRRVASRICFGGLVTAAVLLIGVGALLRLFVDAATSPRSGSAFLRRRKAPSDIRLWTGIRLLVMGELPAELRIELLSKLLSCFRAVFGCVFVQIPKQAPQQAP